MTALSQKLQELIDAGWSTGTPNHHHQWSRRVIAFLNRAVGEKTAADFSSISEGDWETTRDAKIGMLEGLVAWLEMQNSADGQPTPAERENAKSVPLHPKRLFIVHGHDTEVKEKVARFAEHLGLEPIILHEQPSSGRTTIEKFEVYADVGFAVVLLTPDDIGGTSASKPGELKGRARQNVILELGYFLGKLSRRRVCALYKSGVEIPSDYQGVLYVELDSAGAWRTKLAQELVEAGFSIRLESLLHS
jgi:predicted nucleotide-binding protein